jgi:hypothetical protein
MLLSEALARELFPPLSHLEKVFPYSRSGGFRGLLPTFARMLQIVLDQLQVARLRSRHLFHHW